MSYQQWTNLRNMLINQGASHIYPADTHTPHRVTARVYRVSGDVVQMRELAESSRGGSWKPLYYWAAFQGDIPNEAIPIADADVLVD